MGGRVLRMLQIMHYGSLPLMERNFTAHHDQSTRHRATNIGNAITQCTLRSRSFLQARRIYHSPSVYRSVLVSCRTRMRLLQPLEHRARVTSPARACHCRFSLKLRKDLDANRWPPDLSPFNITSFVIVNLGRG